LPGFVRGHGDTPKVDYGEPEEKMRPRQTCKSSKRQNKLRRFQLGGIESLEPRVLFSTYTVTSLADDGTTGTLRWAVQQASADAGPDTIDFASGVTGTITLTQGDLEFTGGNTTVVGPGSDQLTISGGGATSDLRVDPLATVSFSGLSINDGADFLGSGIDNLGSVSLSDCILSNNVSSSGLGGAIFDSGTLSVTDSTFSNNTGSYGGAIYADGDTLTISGSTFSDNSTDTDGGAIDADFASVNIVNSTFAGNSTAGEGGAIFATGGSVTITNSTLSTNSAGTDGGGIHVDPGSGDVTLYNTIVAGNTLSDGVTPSDIDGTLDQSLSAGQTASSNNLVGTGGSGGLINGTAGNLVGVANADLGPLQDNGGPTQTMALLSGSPAANAGNNSLAVDANGVALANDQRDVGYPRVIGGVVDIGAVESPFLPAVPSTQATPTLTVSSVTATEGKRVKLTATLLGTDSAALKHQTITFTLDGQVVGTARTNCQGEATLRVRLDNIAPGSYAGGVVANFSGNTDYSAAQATAALTINEAPIEARCPDISTCGAQTQLLAEFTQDTSGAAASDYTATINWGDGSADTMATITAEPFCGHWFVLSGKHSYAAVTVKTTYDVTVTITPEYGATKTVTGKVTLEPPPKPAPAPKAKGGH
jgi:predicted outer membrane repeat protein